LGRVDVIRDVALKLFLEKGYAETSIRDIAASAGINSATLYHYFPSKEAILSNIVSRNWNEIFDGLSDRMSAATDGNWTDKLRAFVEFHAKWHCMHPEVRILSTDMRSLDEPARRNRSAKRDEFERLLRDLLQEGVTAGEFAVQDVKVTSYAILQMITGIVAWYRPHGRLNPDDISALYWDMISSIVHAHPEGACHHCRDVRKLPPESNTDASMTSS
jgi:AcrR family transcriptional regulator